MPRTRVVIQSRLNSSRLPGKALLTIAGMPLIELVARRAARSGHEVVVATSEERYDGRIVAHLTATGITSMRGSLDDVLGRFVAATSDLAPSDRVVRLTGDNPFVDADLVDELLLAWGQTDHVYGRVDIDRVPVGLGAEVFTVAALRQAADSTTDAYDREHVTPWLRRQLGELLFVPARTPEDPRPFRCTIDVLADYERASTIFGAVSDPVGAPWPELLTALGGRFGTGTLVPTRDRSELRQSVLILGATQLGLDYGVCNTVGRPTMPQVRNMLRVAVERGITHVDTARTDGDSEARLRRGAEPALAQRLRFVTKVGPLSGRTVPADPLLAALTVEASLERSFAELGRRRADAVLLTRASDASALDGAAWRRLLAYRTSGEVGRVGVCVRSPEELAAALDLEGIGYLELPFNILDRRWLGSVGVERLDISPDVVVTAYDVYLRGLLPATAGPSRAIPLDVAALRRQLAGLARDLGRVSVADLCMAYALGHPWITSVAVGAENVDQVRENADLATLPHLSRSECDAVRAEIAPGSQALLDRNWPPL